MIYECSCDVCGKVYIGETERSLGERTTEHAKSLAEGDSKSALSQHQVREGHVFAKQPMIEKMKVLEKEARNPHRKVKEAIHIQMRGASLNRNTSQELPDIYLPLLREEIRRAVRASARWA